ncbi:MAG: NAD(P)-dependent dehydrogenase (short-subunit alcohol dehydrogenase family) [Candidatus Promineifilaceae bacterium]|jgi:NAD(P)-dependent dehydrogenase (short-subunit alcohol dehydrogenase family)
MSNSMDLSVDLSGKVALVTGGGGILCSQMAKDLAASGAAVAVMSRTQAKVQAVADAITAAGGKAIAVSCDVLDRDALEAARERIESELGPVDILVNGAGGNHPLGTATVNHCSSALLDNTPEGTRTFFDLDLEGVSFVFNVNVIGTLLPSQVFARSMAQRGEGCIINISSMSAYTALTRVGAYSAAKAAINNFTGWLAVHLSKCGVRVNAIAPGFFLTEQNRALLTTEDGGLSERGQTIMDSTPMGEFGSPEDLSGTLLWLASSSSRFITGTVIPVDGGFNAFSGV